MAFLRTVAKARWVQWNCLGNLAEISFCNGAIGSLPHVAFLTPNKQHVLIVSNTSDQANTFSIRCNGNDAVATLAAGAVATYIW